MGFTEFHHVFFNRCKGLIINPKEEAAFSFQNCGCWRPGNSSKFIQPFRGWIQSFPPDFRQMQDSKLLRVAKWNFWWQNRLIVDVFESWDGSDCEFFARVVLFLADFWLEFMKTAGESKDQTVHHHQGFFPWMNKLLGLSHNHGSVENGYIWKVTTIGDTPIFDFHDYGRKCNMIYVWFNQESWKPCMATI